MAKAKTKKITKPDFEENILVQSLDQIMSDRFGRYSKYVIQGRALPDVRDGLKPVQRRILFSMSELGLYNGKPFKKSARVVGDVIGKYHPHGDSSIYEAMVRMSQDWKMNSPLIEMHGNNGSIDDDPAAAMRYTEARLAKLANELLVDITKDTVPFAPNFDDSEKEPTVLPALLPNMLLNGARGIAAGYATEMPPHNLGEIIDATIYKIKHPGASLTKLMKFIKGPDFPTGGIIMGKSGIEDAFATGGGRIVIRSKYEIVEEKKSTIVTITEIPYGVNKSKLVRNLDEIRFHKKIHGIIEVRDDTDRHGISIRIELTKDANISLVMNYLLSKTELQIYYSYNSIAIKDLAPVKLSLSNIIDAYLAHQDVVIKNSFKYDLAKQKTRLEIVQGLIKVAGIADKVIDVIRKSSGRQNVIEALVKTFAFTKLQAAAIADLRLYRLSQTDQSAYIEEEKSLQDKITFGKHILRSKVAFDELLTNKLKAMKKVFAVPRKSVIEDEMAKIEYNMEDLIKHENIWVGVSKTGYIKRVSTKSYESNEINKYGIKDEDSIVYLDKVNTSEKLLVFMRSGKYIFIPNHKLIDDKWSNVGKHLNDYASIEPRDEVIAVINVGDFSIRGFILLVTRSGRAKRVPIKDFETSRHSKAMTAFKIDSTDLVVSVKVTNGYKDVLIITNEGKAVKYSETDLPTQSTKSKGGKAISLTPGSFVTTAVAIGADDVVGLISNRGGVKRIRSEEVQPSGKNTKGKVIFRQQKGKQHLAIDASVVMPQTLYFFTTKTKELKLYEFKEVPISKHGDGFSRNGPKNAHVGKIFFQVHVKKGNEFFTTPTKESIEEQFSKAEKEIDKISQLSLDDLLKDL